jgi:hypothetical protein
MRLAGMFLFFAVFEVAIFAFALAAVTPLFVCCLLENSLVRCPARARSRGLFYF